jgi:hypothetical protein
LSKIIGKNEKFLALDVLEKDLFSKIIGKKRKFLAVGVLEKDLFCKIIGKIIGNKKSFWLWKRWKRMSFPRSLPKTKFLAGKRSPKERVFWLKKVPGLEKVAGCVLFLCRMCKMTTEKARFELKAAAVSLSATGQ